MGLKEMRFHRNKKVAPSPLTIHLANRLTPFDLVGIVNTMIKCHYEQILTIMLGFAHAGQGDAVPKRRRGGVNTLQNEDLSDLLQ